MELIPPGDVAWLWHCHRLSPLRYQRHLEKQFNQQGLILEANPPFAVQCPAPVPPTATAAESRQQEQIQQLQKFYISTSIIRFT